MFDRAIAEKVLFDEFGIYKNKDCRNGYTTYRAEGLRGVVIHIAWNLTPIKVYVSDPKREIKMRFDQKGNMGRREEGKGQKLTLMCDHLSDLRDLRYIARIALDKNTYPGNLTRMAMIQYAFEMLESDMQQPQYI